MFLSFAETLQDRKKLEECLTYHTGGKFWRCLFWLKFNKPPQLPDVRAQRGARLICEKNGLPFDSIKWEFIRLLNLLHANAFNKAGQMTDQIRRVWEACEKCKEQNKKITSQQMKKIRE